MTRRPVLARLRSTLPIEDLVVGARFLRGLPALLRHPLSVEEARAIVGRRLEHREADFLALARRAIYANPASPYRQLFGLAGCEYGDLERLVSREGVEGALRGLHRNGVYLSADEFKGRRPAVRGSATIEVGLARLANPLPATHVSAQSSGSRGAGTMVPIDLAFVRDQAVMACLAMEARGGGRWRHAFWGVPGGAAMIRLLEFGAFGAPPVRWFSQVDPGAPGLHPRYRWSVWAMRWGSRLAGVPLPRPRYLPLDDPLPIARWMAGVLRAGGTPHLYTYASPAVRLCEAASEAGIRLDGAQFTVSGEPFTAARLATVRRAGAVAVPRYGSIECSLVAYGCLAPEESDDLHLLHDLHALIQPGADGEPDGLAPDTLLISSLRATAPFILLNVSLGDRARVVRQACGCPLERLGWATHLHGIRSDEKLTAGGMAFLDLDIVRVLEEVLPARFGGGPTNYQLVEEEAEGGQPRLRLLVDPALGPLDEPAVAEAFLSAIGRGSGAQRVMALQWRQAGLLRVERHPPLATRSGKILHLHQVRPAPADTVPLPSSDSDTAKGSR